LRFAIGSVVEFMKVSGLAKEGWRPAHLWLAAVLVCAAVAVTYQAWADMARIAWLDEECGHALLVLPAFAWLAWIRRGRIRRCQPRGCWLGTLLVAAGWIIWSIGFRKQWQPLWHGGALIFVLGAFFTAVGTQVLWQFFAAFAILAFLVPVPVLMRQAIAVRFQAKTAEATQIACEAMGMPVERQTCLLTVHGHQVAVSEACNGMRMVFALILVCYLFAFVVPLRGYVRFLLLALSPIVAVLCNIIRLVPTVWVYGNFPAETAEKFHDVTGWVMLVAAFLTMIGILRLLRWAMLPVTHFRLVDMA
jgi:exosortase